MSYGVKEVFYTLQGEGANAGRAAVFLRFSGCNLWNGREEDRARGSGGCSLWCDTDFFGTDGVNGGHYKTAGTLADVVERQWAGGVHHRFVVCTGGEPLLQLDASLVSELRERGFRVAVETNGTRPVPEGVDWVCLSPKHGAPVVVTRVDEVKFVYPQQGLDPRSFEFLECSELFIQPKDGLERRLNTERAVEFCKANPQWRLGLQMHKFAEIP